MTEEPEPTGGTPRDNPPIEPPAPPDAEPLAPPAAAASAAPPPPAEPMPAPPPAAGGYPPPAADAGAYPQAAAPFPGTVPTPAAPARKSGRLRPVIILAVIVGFIAVVLFVTRNNVEADDLKVGDCFNEPTGETFQTVEKSKCTESHTAEVVFIGEYPSDTFPISLSLNSYIEDNCVPAFETYIGRTIDSEPALELGYITPTQDGWKGGDRTITCYLTQPGSSPMTESLKAS